MRTHMLPSTHTACTHTHTDRESVPYVYIERMSVCTHHRFKHYPMCNNTYVTIHIDRSHVKVEEKDEQEIKYVHMKGKKYIHLYAYIRTYEAVIFFERHWIGGKKIDFSSRSKRNDDREGSQRDERVVERKK